MHLRHVVQEHHIRNDADQGPGNDQHHQRAGGTAAKDPNPRQQDQGSRDCSHWGQTHLQNRNPGRQLVLAPMSSSWSLIQIDIYFILYLIFSAPYGIFARSCVAMAKDSKSTFQIIDDEGLVTSNSRLNRTRLINYCWFFRCPVDPSIFPSFTPDGNALQSVYEAFRFTESYGVIFQCNVKYCLGPCEPVIERTTKRFT